MPSVSSTEETTQESMARSKDFFFYPYNHIRLKASQDHLRTCERLYKLFKQAELPFRVAARRDAWQDQLQDPSTDYVISTGGDGTFLESASHLTSSHTTLIGIRSSRYSAGELCAFKECQLDQLVEILTGSKTFKHCLATRMQATIITEQQLLQPSLSTPPQHSVPVLNDCLFVSAHPGAASRYLLRGNACGTPLVEKHISSGIWVYTGTGSTAGALSAGGKPFAKDDPKLAFRLREPLRQSSGMLSYACPPFKLHNGDFLPIAAKNYSMEHLYTQPLIIKNLMEKAYLVVDGRDELLIHRGDMIIFEPAPPLKLVDKIDKNNTA